MTRLLVDTHILLWSQLEPARLSPAVAAALDDSNNEVWISPLTIWEISTLLEKRRLRLHMGLEPWVASLAGRRRLREAFLTTAIVLAATQMRFQHRDPVDRFLAATAKVEGLTLVTADAQLLRRSDIALMANGIN